MLKILCNGDKYEVIRGRTIVRDFQKFSESKDLLGYGEIFYWILKIWRFVQPFCSICVLAEQSNLPGGYSKKNASLIILWVTLDFVLRSKAIGYVNDSRRAYSYIRSNFIDNVLEFNKEQYIAVLKSIVEDDKIDVACYKLQNSIVNSLVIQIFILPLVLMLTLVITESKLIGILCWAVLYYILTETNLKLDNQNYKRLESLVISAKKKPYLELENSIS